MEIGENTFVENDIEIRPPVEKSPYDGEKLSFFEVVTKAKRISASVKLNKEDIPGKSNH